MAINYEAQGVILDRCMKDLSMCVAAFEQWARDNPRFFKEEAATRARIVHDQLKTNVSKLERIVSP